MGADGCNEFKSVHPRQMEIRHKRGDLVRGQTDQRLFRRADRMDDNAGQLHESHFEHIAAWLGIFDDEDGASHLKKRGATGCIDTGVLDERSLLGRIDRRYMIFRTRGGSGSRRRAP